jgi:3-oxoacyl-(acyl-carrier-protein) synthase
MASCLTTDGPIDLLLASANGTFVDEAEEEMAAKFCPKAAVYTPKPALGESIAAGGMWQTICAALALRRQQLPPLLSGGNALRLTTAHAPKEQPWKRALVTSCGMNQQFAGLILRR